MARHLHSLYIKKHCEVAPCYVGEKDCPPEMMSLMKRCIAADPKDRPTMEEVCLLLEKLPMDWVPMENPAVKVYACHRRKNVLRCVHLVQGMLQHVWFTQ